MAPMQKVSDTHKHIKKRVLIVCGPTASGKTKLALTLARRFNGELVNADSRQMYKGMDVLSGKDIPTGVKPYIHERRIVKGETVEVSTYDMYGIPLWLYDAAPITQSLSVSHFQEIASYVISDIQKRGKLPIVVGGTGFYLSTLVDGIDTIHIPQDHSLRGMLAEKTVKDLQDMLSVVDPTRWKGMNNSDTFNSRRLIRAIEVATWKKEHPSPRRQNEVFDAMWVGLRCEVDDISKRISARVAARFNNGAVEEVIGLGKISVLLPADSMLGVSVLRDYIRGSITAEETKRLWAIEELQYAKRQMVWFRKRSDIHWFDSEKDVPSALLENLVREWYT